MIECWDWTAVSAIGTFVVAAVALMPIFIEACRRRALARNLRGQLLAEIPLLRIVIDTMVVGQQNPLQVRAALDTFDGLSRRAELLKPDEQLILLRAMANLNVLQVVGGLTAAQGQQLHAVLEQLAAAIEGHGMTRATLVVPPQGTP